MCFVLSFLQLKHVTIQSLILPSQSWVAEMAQWDCCCPELLTIILICLSSQLIMQFFLEWHQVLCVRWPRGTFPGSALAAQDPSSLSSFYFSLTLCWHTVKTAAQAAIFPYFPLRFLSSPCQHLEMVLITSSLPESSGLTPHSDTSNICCTTFFIYNNKSWAEFLFWSDF